MNHKVLNKDSAVRISQSQIPMPFSPTSATKPSTLLFFFHVLLTFLLVTSYGAQASNDKRVTNVGAIIDVDSRTGKERKAAMEIAARNFNDSSKNQKLSLYFQDSTRAPLEAASNAENLIEEKKVEVIVGMETWQEAVSVGKVGNQTQVPVISLVAPSITPPLMQLRWPYLVSMANDASAEVKCIADLICAYHWRKVVIIYEDDEYGGNDGTLALLNEALQNVGSKIEYRLVLPPYSSLSNPKGFVLDELLKLLSVQSRAFIVLRSSLPMVTHLFREAKKIGLLEKDSAWIMTESVTSLLDSVDNSVIPFLKGTLGIKTYYKNTSSYNAFHTQFQSTFQEENPDEGNSNPGIYALQAYDSIQAIIQALERTSSNSSTKMLMENILSANFDGLSGKVSFKEGKLLPNQILGIVNVDGNGDKELDCWVPEYGFTDCLVTEKGQVKNRRADGCKNSKGLAGSVVWPGNLENRNPKGWAMPTIAKPLKIGVPSDTQFKKFVTVDKSKQYLNEGYDGFCIRIFRMVLPHLNYALPYEFTAFNGSYDELIDAVYNRTYDAAVGDMTILSERLNKVEFTQPYAESGLSVIFPIKSEESAWMFVKPFTWEMWVTTIAILVYTMLIVWFLEHPTNPEFSGTLKDQIGTAFWFTCSSIFFAQRERVHSNITRVAVMMWFFVVFILTASYTASLSSILTVKQLEHDIDIDWLIKNNKNIGCDGDSFVKKYLENVLKFRPDNIHVVPEENDYLEWFKKNITAAFLELPYEKVFINKHCKKFTTNPATQRFGGLGFVFQKGSPITKDISEAILKLSENGNITRLEKECLTPSDECSSTTIETERLSLNSFWGIYLISGATSTICFLISLVRLQRNYRHHSQGDAGNIPIKIKALELARYLYNGQLKYSPGRVSNTTTTNVSSHDMPSMDEGNSSRWEFMSTSGAPDHVDTSSPAEIEITTA